MLYDIDYYFNSYKNHENMLKQHINFGNFTF